MACKAMEKRDLFQSMESLEYFQSISRIFPYHGEQFHSMKLDKTMEIGFSNLFLNNISKIFHTMEDIQILEPSH